MTIHCKPLALIMADYLTIWSKTIYPLCDCLGGLSRGGGKPRPGVSIAGHSGPNQDFRSNQLPAQLCAFNQRDSPPQVMPNVNLPLGSLTELSFSFGLLWSTENSLCFLTRHGRA